MGWKNGRWCHPAEQSILPLQPEHCGLTYLIETNGASAAVHDEILGLLRD
jgi:hypothetical protein